MCIIKLLSLVLKVCTEDLLRGLQYLNRTCFGLLGASGFLSGSPFCVVRDTVLSVKPEEC